MCPFLLLLHTAECKEMYGMQSLLEVMKSNDLHMCGRVSWNTLMVIVVLLHYIPKIQTCTARKNGYK